MGTLPSLSRAIALSRGAASSAILLSDIPVRLLLELGAPPKSSSVSFRFLLILKPLKAGRREENAAGAVPVSNSCLRG